MKVFIFTEGSWKVGFGHISRCAALYEAFAAKRVSSEFIINGDKTARCLLKEKKFRFLNWLKDDKVFNLAKEAQIVIVDSYLADARFYRRLSQTTRRCVYLDDNLRLDYPKGVILNGNICAGDFGYPQKKGRRYLLGARYALLRKEFWKVRPKAVNKRLRSLLVMFGGSDFRNMTPKITRLLKEKYPGLKKNISIGKGFKNIAAIERLKDEKINLVYAPSAARTKELMLESDIVISSAGQTVYELARTSSAAVVCAVAGNQLNNVRALQETGLFAYAGWWQDPCLPAKIIKGIELFSSYPERLRQKDMGPALVDGKGAQRAVEALLG